MIPLSAYGHKAAAPLGCVTLNGSSQINTLVAGYVSNSGGSTEGAQTIVAGVGPGPYNVSNNYFSASGLFMHFDDLGDTRIRGDYLIERNT